MDYLKRLFLGDMDNEIPDIFDNPFIGESPAKEKIEKAKEKGNEIADGLLDDIDAEFEE